MTRGLQFGKYGLQENPVGLHVTWKIGERDYLATVVNVYRCDVRSVTMLKTRFLNGEDGPDVGASVVTVLEDR